MNVLKPWKYLASGCAALILAGVAISLAPTAHADTILPPADTVFQAWNDSFLVQAEEGREPARWR